MIDFLDLYCNRFLQIVVCWNQTSETIDVVVVTMIADKNRTRLMRRFDLTIQLFTSVTTRQTKSAVEMMRLSIDFSMIVDLDKHDSNIDWNFEID